MNLFNKLKSNSVTPLFQRKSGHFVVDDNNGIALLVASSYKNKKEPILLITSNLYKAQQVYSALVSFLGKEDVLLFPSDELIRAETIAQSKEMAAHRLFVLNEILHRDNPIVIANLASATRYLPSPELFKERTFTLKKGKHYQLDDIRRKLIKDGYQLVNKVDQSLQFAIRGDVLDIFSVNNDNPVRIEFFDDEIESMRYFDLAKQTSIGMLDEVTILPASDILFNDEDLAKSGDKLYANIEKDKEVIGLTLFEKLRDTVDDLAFTLSEGQIDEKFYKYYGFLTKDHYSIFDYCKDYKNVFIDMNGIKNSNDMFIRIFFWAFCSRPCMSLATISKV